MIIGSGPNVIKAWNGARPVHKIEIEGSSIMASGQANPPPTLLTIDLLTEIRDTLVKATAEIRGIKARIDKMP